MTTPTRDGPASPQGRWHRLVHALQRFWFTPADPTMLGLIRVCCGLVLLHVLVLTGPHLQEFYGAGAWIDRETMDELRKEAPNVARRSDFDENAPPRPRPRPPRSQEEADELRKREEYRQKWGVDPEDIVARGQAVFSVWYHVTDPRWMAFLHGVFIVVAVLFTLGVATRVTAVLAWLVALSYIHRIPTGIFGMDTMLALVLLYMMIAPCGAALSVDRVVARFRVFRRLLSQRRPAPALLRPAPRASANFVLRLMQIHFCIIYLASGLSKLQGAAWWNGTALWQTSASFEFVRPYPFTVDVLRFLTAHRWLWELVFEAGALFTLALEIGLPFLIWVRRFRWILIIGAVFLHTGIAVQMGLVDFSLLMLTILAAFVPAEALHRLLARVGRGRARLRLAYNQRDAGQVRQAALARTFDIWGQVALDAGQPPRLQLQEDGRAQRTGYAIFERLTRALRILWPVALLTWIPGMARVGRALAPEGQAKETAPPAPKKSDTVGTGERR
jgi:hypothetical protein